MKVVKAILNVIYRVLVLAMLFYICYLLEHINLNSIVF